MHHNLNHQHNRLATNWWQYVQEEMQHSIILASTLLSLAWSTDAIGYHSSLVDGVRTFQLVNVSTLRRSSDNRTIELSFRAFGRHFDVQLHALDVQVTRGIRLEVHGSEDPLADRLYYRGRVRGRESSSTAQGFFDFRTECFDGQIDEADGEVFFIRPLHHFARLRRVTTPANAVVYRASEAFLGDDSEIDLAGDSLTPPLPLEPLIGRNASGVDRAWHGGDQRHGTRICKVSVCI